MACFFTFTLAQARHSSGKRPKTRVNQSGSCPTIPNFVKRSSRLRIIGGKRASAPISWQVSLQFVKGNYYCGGTILDSTTILSAAHCLDNKGWNYTKHYVLAGRTSIKMIHDRIRIAQVILHPGYDKKKPPTFENDIAIVKLSKPLIFSRNIQPMCLPSKDFKPYKGERCLVSGWGLTKFGNN